MFLDRVGLGRVFSLALVLASERSNRGGLAPIALGICRGFERLGFLW